MKTCKECGPADVVIENHGSIFTFAPQNDAAKAWLEEHTDGTWLGNRLGVEPRYAADLAAGLREEGFALGKGS